ncbi:WecB/TagA/CpsF family glycosyltransferase, partial [Candidatus Microgenomates bacterium]|nr:WecB/TagA/CpsF family glycosyltransferase [Candidatus Microgenomates bacterium]
MNIGLKTKSILGISITIDTKEKVLKEVGKWLKKPRTKDQKLGTEDKNSLVIFTPNPEIITYAQKDDNFRRIVNSAQINIPDGSGISWAMKKTYGLEINRISGVDFMFELCRLSLEKSLTVGLIGGRGGVAVDAGECLRKKFLGLKVEVLKEAEIRIQNSEFRIQNDCLGDGKKRGKASSFQVEELEKRYFYSLANEIDQKKVDILFVALGCPKQEYFIEEIRKAICGKNTSEVPIKSGRGDRLKRRGSLGSSEVKGLVKPLILMSVGGAFDYISGRIPRA